MDVEMMTDDEIMAVVQAHKEGNQIQAMPHNSEVWHDCLFDPPRWDFGTFKYRVAPEPRKPREWNVVVDDNGRLLFDAIGQFPRGSRVKVREVIE